MRERVSGRGSSRGALIIAPQCQETYRALFWLPGPVQSSGHKYIYSRERRRRRRRQFVTSLASLGASQQTDRRADTQRGEQAHGSRDYCQWLTSWFGLARWLLADQDPRRLVASTKRERGGGGGGAQRTKRITGLPRA